MHACTRTLARRYALFATTFLGYGQAELSLTASAAAGAALLTQLLLLPRLLERVGEAASCVAGLALLGVTMGASSLVRTQPLHFGLFVASRAGHALAETSNTALTARASPPERRARNLALLHTFQSGSRLVSPMLANYLFTLSRTGGAGGGAAAIGPAGALPFLTVAALAIASAPLPLLLPRVGATKPEEQ